MRVLLTGATGFVGRALVLRLLGDGHEIVAAVRSAERAQALLGPDVETLPIDDDDALRAELGRVDAVVHLAGENVLGGRWTRQRRRALWSSRVELTERLVRLLGEQARPPRVMISASAVGLYGDRGDELLDEGAEPGTGFLPDLCRRWEAAALEARRCGTRVAVLRIGVVLGAEGGALGSMLPAFQLGLGARLGDGRQAVSWIHLRDLTELIVRGIADPRFDGPVNAVAPHPVTNAELTRELAAALGRTARLRLPGAVLRLLLGQGAEVTLQSQRVSPRRAREAGFRFRHPFLAEALRDLLAPLRSVSIERARGTAVMGLRRRRPHYVLTHRTRIDARLDEAFAFFSRPHNLALVTPSWTRFRFVGEPPPETREGLEIRYRIALGPVPFDWRSRITAFEPGRRFVDEQVRGPYALWHHEHRLEPDGEGTVMVDRVFYRVPFGGLGRLAHPLLVAPALRRIFAYRDEAVALRFTRASAPAMGEAA